MCCVASSLSLLALVAGAFLLAKTRKDDLGAAFKWLSYFVIFASLTIFICSAGHDIARCMGCKGKSACPMMQDCEKSSSCEAGGMMRGHGQCPEMSSRCGGHGMKGGSCEGMKGCPMGGEEEEEEEGEKADSSSAL